MVTAKNILGPSKSIGSIYLDYIGWPTRSSCPLLLNGPMWAFPSSAVKLHVGFSDYYNKMFVMGSTTHEKEILEGFRLDPTNEYRHCEYKKLVPGTFDAFKRSREPSKEPEDNWRDFIPKEYHQYAKVFSSHAVMRFPNPRPWDHEIELLSDAPQTLNCKVYPLPP